MIVIDIRNTNIVIDIYINSKLSYVSNFETKSEKFHIQIK